MEEHLQKVISIIEEYENTQIRHLERLNELLQSLTTRLVHLEVYRAEYHDKFQNIIYDLTRDKMTVSRAENQANVEVPEMYMLRRIMSAAYRTADSLRTNISFMKNELKF